MFFLALRPMWWARNGACACARIPRKTSGACVWVERRTLCRSCAFVCSVGGGTGIPVAGGSRVPWWSQRDNWCSRLKGGEDTVFLVCVRIACRGLFLGKLEETFEAANRVANDLLAYLSTSQLGRCSRASPPTT